jgi:Immunity protein 63
MLTLAQIKTEVDQRAAIIGASGDSSLPTYGRTDDSGRGHLEVDQLSYHYVIAERGQENSRVSTTDLDAVLYLVFQAVTFSIAMKYEVKHRIRTQDCRRILFKHQIELLSKLSEAWSRRCAQERDVILRKHPFDDNTNVRTAYTVNLRKQGYAPDTAWQLACEKYPVPAGA